jgi:hypothetical protein
VSDKLLSQFAERAIEYIASRSEDGRDVNGKTFKEYSKDYAKFKGVGRGDVDMTLLGDMLLSLGFEIEGDGKIKLMVAEDQTGKAYGHMTGFKGHPFIKNGPKREFFGLTDEDVLTLASDVIKGLGKRKKEDAQDNLDEIISNLGLELDDGED